MRVAVVGDAPDYRAATSAPVVSVSVTDPAVDDADWFDLGHHRHRRRPGRALRPPVPRAGDQADAPVPARGHLLPARRARVRRAGPADRRGRGAAGPPHAAHPDQPVAGRAVGRPAPAGRRRRAERPVGAQHRGPAGAGDAAGARRARRDHRAAAALPARGLPLAELPVGPRPRRRARRRHGAGQDAAGPGAAAAGQGRRPADRAGPGGGPHQRGRQLAGRGRPVRPRPGVHRGGGDVGQGRGAAGHPGRRRRPGDHLLHPAAAGRGRVRRGDLARDAAGRGAVREEPAGQGLPGGPHRRRPVQAGHHRHADGEQPDGPVVPAVHLRPGPVPRPRGLQRAVAPAHRARHRPRPAGHPAPPAAPA